MNSMSFKPVATDRLRQVQALAEGPRTILYAKALLGHANINKTAFVDCLMRSELKMTDRRKWNHQAISAALNTLSQLHLLDARQNCPLEILHQVTCEAADSAQAADIVSALRRAFPAVPFFSTSIASFAVPPGFAINLRVAAYLNDATAFDTARNQCIAMLGRAEADAVVLFVSAGAPLERAWLATRALPIRLALLEAAFLPVRMGMTHHDIDEMLAEARPAFAGAEMPKAEVFFARYDVFRLDIEQATTRVAALGGPLTEQGAKLAGALALLGADIGGAIEAYRQAHKILRKTIGKRKVIFDDEHAIFFLLALLGARDAKLHPEIQAGIDAARAGHQPHEAAIEALQAVLWLVQGLESKARSSLDHLLRAMPTDALSEACILLALQLFDADRLPAHRQAIDRRFASCRESLPLVAHFFAEFLLAAGGDTRAAAAYLAKTGASVKLRLCRLLEAEPAWMRALTTLDAQIFGAPPAKAEPTVKPKRLVWFIDIQERTLQPAEQVARGEAGFSDGRPVALKRLHENDPRLDYLTDQDRAAIKGLRRLSVGYYGESAYEFDALRSFPALVGHPALFDAKKRSVQLAFLEGTPELVVSESRGMFHLSLSHASDEPALFLEAETPTRFRVIVFPQKLLPIQEVLGREGLRVPQEGRDRLLALVRRGQPSLPIRTEIEGFGPEAVPGDPAPVVQMLPQGESVKISLLVRPFGAQGPAYVAGLGNRVVTTQIAGAPHRAARDLRRELANRAALLEACASLRDRSSADGHEAVIDDLETQLEILLELQAFQDKDPARLSIEWPDGRRIGVRALGAEKMKLRVAQDRDWFSVDGSFAIDDGQVLDMRFLLDRLDRAHGRFVRLDDGSFIALTRQLQQQLGRLAAVSEPHKNGQRLHALGAPALRDILQDAGEIKQDAAWKKHVARITAAEGIAPSVPQGLQAELRDYQIEGFTWMARLAAWGAGACLADDMGLGKTVQAIAVMLSRAAEGPILVVAPTSVCANWVAEIARFAPTLTAHRLAGAPDRAALVAALGPSDVLICSYGLLHTEQASLGAKPWAMAVLDEAQAIKNAATRRAQASLELQAGFRLALTGTPVENDLDELWSLFSFVNPGLLGARENFAKRFAIPIARDRDPQARAALRALVRPFLLRRTKAAVLSELPSRTEQTLLVEMGEAERAFYEAMRQRAMEKLDSPESAGPGRKIRILAEITRLRRACCNPALIDPAAELPSGKMDALLELVDELSLNRHRALVFSQFTSHLALVRTALEARGVDYEYLDGSTPPAERERRVASFQSGTKPLFLISLKAGGTGLNLTAADYVVHLDPWWNPAVEDQASDRAHRIGQTRPVTIYRLIMQGSIEERIVALHRDKRDLAADLLDGAEMSARLSEEALLELIRS